MIMWSSDAIRRQTKIVVTNGSSTGFPLVRLQVITWINYPPKNQTSLKIWLKYKGILKKKTHKDIPMKLTWNYRLQNIDHLM